MKSVKRGISSLIVTVLLVLIIMAAIALIWRNVLPVVSDSVKISQTCSLARLTIDSASGNTCFDSPLHTLSISVQRDAHEYDIAGIQIGVASKGVLQSYTVRNTTSKYEVLSLQLDDGAGTVAADWSGHNSHGSIRGPQWIDGRIGSALYFKGSIQPGFPGDYVLVGDMMPTGEYTKIAWVKRTAGDAWDMNNIVSGNSSLSSGGHAFWAPSGYGFRLSAGHGSVWDEVQDPVSLVNDTWYFVAVTYDPQNSSGLLVLYKDGVEVDRQTAVAPHNQNSTVYVGAYAQGSNFNGTIDAVRIYRYALEATEIAEVYQSDMHGKFNISAPLPGTNGAELYHLPGIDIEEATVAPIISTGVTETLCEVAERAPIRKCAP